MARPWILIVEGEKGVCEGLKQLISEQGFSVLSCSECSKAYWLLQNQKFACVRQFGFLGSKISGALLKPFGAGEFLEKVRRVVQPK